MYIWVSPLSLISKKIWTSRCLGGREAVLFHQDCLNLQSIDQQELLGFYVSDNYKMLAIQCVRAGQNLVQWFKFLKNFMIILRISSDLNNDVYTLMSISDSVLVLVNCHSDYNIQLLKSILLYKFESSIQGDNHNVSTMLRCEFLEYSAIWFSDKTICICVLTDIFYKASLFYWRIWQGCILNDKCPGWTK